MRLKIISNQFLIWYRPRRCRRHTALIESPACIPITQNAIGLHTDGSTSEYDDGIISNYRHITWALKLLYEYVNIKRSHWILKIFKEFLTTHIIIKKLWYSTIQLIRPLCTNYKTYARYLTIHIPLLISLYYKSSLRNHIVLHRIRYCYSHHHSFYIHQIISLLVSSYLKRSLRNYIV